MTPDELTRDAALAWQHFAGMLRQFGADAKRAGAHRVTLHILYADLNDLARFVRLNPESLTVERS